MLDAFLRLVRLLDSEGDIPIFAPIIIREIYSRLLVGPLGGHVRGFCTRGTQNNRIMRAVDWLKGNYDKPIRIEELAKRANMAPTTFHRHFRKVTSVSPIQYQKNLRLHEGKRLMIAENETVAEAAYAVGYESRRNSAENTSACSAPLQSATSRRSIRKLPEFPAGLGNFSIGTYIYAPQIFRIIRTAKIQCIGGLP